MILCGGPGERLWPASRPGRPKPFLKLVGDLSGLQDALVRAAPLAAHGRLVVTSAAAHAQLVAEQLSAVGQAAAVLLEPDGRNTAAAIAAAAAWVARQAPDAVLAVLPADHHAPDGDAFRAAIRAAADVATDGAIVLLGAKPDRPHEAYGYIRPAALQGLVAPVAEFVEKPSPERAGELIAAGALWNCGVFVASARTLLSETARWAPEVAEATGRAVEQSSEAAGAHLLGAAFVEAPAISFDRAVVERTDRAAVLPVTFAWSDLGAWDAVLAAAPKDARGNSLSGAVAAPGSSDILARAAPGVRVAAVGVSRLAVVAEPGGVLVCGLDSAQAVRELSAWEGRAGRFADMAEAAAWCSGWLATAALPLWATVGVDPATGGFREALNWDGAPADPRRRARVQARQAFVFATAATDGLPGPWLRTAREGIEYFLAHARRDDGLFAACLDLDGGQTDPTPRLYEHAFLLLALSAMAEAEPAEGAWRDEARAIAERMDAFRHPAGGYREAGAEPFQANAHMHLFEAFLAWAAVDPAGPWRGLADEVADLALARFIDPASGALLEAFDESWAPRSDADWPIEPGHQFEWAWLLDRWAALHGDGRAAAQVRRLFEAGRAGFDERRGVVINALGVDLSRRDPGARLWPQTEHLKAALALGEQAAALEAANSLVAYLDTPARGAWRERMRGDGSFIEEPSPATSLYHLFLAIRELARLAPEPC